MHPIPIHTIIIGITGTILSQFRCRWLIAYRVAIDNRPVGIAGRIVERFAMRYCNWSRGGFWLWSRDWEFLGRLVEFGDAVFEGEYGGFFCFCHSVLLFLFLWVDSDVIR